MRRVLATLTSKHGSWELPHVHMWKKREVQFHAQPTPIIGKETRIATIGSCFALELAAGLDRLGLAGGMHPTGLFYNTVSVRQELERIFGGWPERNQEKLWQTKDGWVHPFKNFKVNFPTEDELRAWSDGLDRKAEDLFKKADVVVVTLGLIEGWRNPVTKNAYRQIPHPDIFEALNAEFFRIRVSEMREDLERIRRVVCEQQGAKLVVTVSPIPLHATLTNNDVRVANTESKSRIRAVVSEFVEDHEDVHYFHSYELVTTCEVSSDFMMEDGRHVHRHAVDYILSDFLRVFGKPELDVPEVDKSFITEPAKTADRPEHAPLEKLTRRAVNSVKRRVNDLLG